MGKRAAKAKRPRCTATTAKSTRCKRLALEGSDICAIHAGAPVGRPTSLTPEVSTRILDIIKAGGYVEAAAQAAGVSRSTFHAWFDRGHPDGVVTDPEKPDERVRRKDDEPFRVFRAKVEQAKAEGEAINVARVSAAAVKDWKAAAWILERTHPDRWGGPRSRSIDTSIHPDDFAGGESSVDGSASQVKDDQVGPDGSAL
jgi:hypothetical protein